MKDTNHMIIWIVAEKALEIIHVNSWQKLSNKWLQNNIPQHNEGHKWEAYSQHLAEQQRLEFNLN